MSVSTQRDTEQALVEKERDELARTPEAEHAELVEMLRERGLTDATSTVVADELTDEDALRTRLTIELGIDQDEIAKPWSAALSSAVAFTAGAALPLLAMLLTPASIRIAISFITVLVGRAITGAISAQLGGIQRVPAITRLVLGGAAAMAVTYGIGQILGVAVD